MYHIVLLFILFVMPDVLLFTLSTMFPEPRVGMALAKGPEKNARGHRNYRHIDSFLATA